MTVRVLSEIVNNFLFIIHLVMVLLKCHDIVIVLS